MRGGETMIQEIRKRMNQKGFTLVELMVVIAILGVLAAIAIPKFNESTAKANTARIQADLRTLDSALVQYQADGGTVTNALSASTDDSDLQKYMTTKLSQLKAPKGDYYVIGKKAPNNNSAPASYAVKDKRAVLGTLTSEQVGYDSTATE